ncbi:hypothetical protein KUTeg_019775 [Tegillarca granosa]|uniref:Uncharacterized protein n=1 Tax=Tegillarca granosa TaxID=220873 RepID=A0ABQ9EDG4_TEGGR|nr:hypothetical protein KUTeg_019775 [Tegillarca granosa]
MRSDRGWITWNETINGIRFPQSSIEFAKVKLPHTRTMRDAIIFAKRFTAQEAKQYGIVDVVTELSDLIEESKTLINKVLGPGGIDKDIYWLVKKDQSLNLVKNSELVGVRKWNYSLLSIKDKDLTSDLFDNVL